MSNTVTLPHRGNRTNRRTALFFAGLLCAACVRPATPVMQDPAGRGTGTIQPAHPYSIGKTSPDPGALYSIDTSTPGDVVYLAGNLPLIISVPHGGSLKPDILPDRRGSWGFINKNDDDATIELAMDIVRAIREKKKGACPHVIINNLSRTKIDQNRGWGMDNNPTTGRGGAAWKDFHERFIAAVAIPAVLRQYGSGLFIDLHGKPEEFGADIIVGYNLTAAELSNSDRHLNTGKKTYPDRSSIRFLSKKLAATATFAELLRGNRPGHESFGSLFQKELDGFNRAYGKNYSVVPRHDLKKPFLNLSGGYNIKAFCGVRDRSFDNPYRYTASRFISGFQIEVSRGIRVKDARLRGKFARALAEALIAYIESNFGIGITPKHIPREGVSTASDRSAALPE